MPDKRPLRVLVSNDDGPPNPSDSPFILPFIEHLENLGWDVKVCLPNSQKSWIAKSFMINDHIELSYYNRKTGEVSFHKENDNDFYLLSGTPATCTNIALNHIFKDQEFDLVIGGPNFGRNSATVYALSSGTVGAAMEAVLLKHKAIALSFAFYARKWPDNEVQTACNMASNVIQHLWDKGQWPEGGLFNVNVPVVDSHRPVYLTRFHKAAYGSLFRRLTDKKAETGLSKKEEEEDDCAVEQEVRKEAEGHESERTVFHFSPDLSAMGPASNAAEGTDAWALHHKFVSVTPMIASFEVESPLRDYGFEAFNNKL